jgi:hypothetical protein
MRRPLIAHLSAVTPEMAALELGKCCRIYKDLRIDTVSFRRILKPMSDSSDTAQLNEVALKCLFLEHLRGQRTIDQNSVIASEYGLGRVGRRIDLAIWAGEFIGIEFKSRFDSLKRLSWQLQAYLQCFDRVILVLDEKHTAKVKACLPAPVELWNVDAFGSFTQISKAGVVRSQTVAALANLCSLTDLRRISYSENDTGTYRGRSRILAEDLDVHEVYEVAIKGFKKSFGNSSRSFWNAVDDTSIDQSKLSTLSRFLAQRTQKQLMQQIEKTFWSNWAQRASETLSTTATAN